MSTLDYILEHLGTSVSENDVHTEFDGKSESEILAILDEWFPSENNQTLAEKIHEFVR